MLIQVSKAQVT